MDAEVKEKLVIFINEMKEFYNLSDKDERYNYSLILKGYVASLFDFGHIECVEYIRTSKGFAFWARTMSDKPITDFINNRGWLK